MTTQFRGGGARRRGQGKIADLIGSERLAWKLAAEQGVAPIENVRDLVGDFWPEDETVDQFIAAMKVWDKEGR